MEDFGQICALPPPPKLTKPRYHSRSKQTDESASKIKSHSLDGDKNDVETCSRSSSLEALNIDSIDYKNGGKAWQEFNVNYKNNEEVDHLLGDDNSDKESTGDCENHETQDNDIWSISPKLRQYYIDKFLTLERDVNGKISGAVAKNFFERSKLSSKVLSKIWQLSDVDRDCALTVHEFCSAMHLVILYQNNVDLPDTLPEALMPPVNETPSIEQDLLLDDEQISPSTNKQWTRFNDSPTNEIVSSQTSSNSSSLNAHSNHSQPAMANFDFNVASIESDPKILHPKAIKLSPDTQNITYHSQSSELLNNYQNFPSTECENSSNHLLPGFSSQSYHNSSLPLPPRPPPRINQRRHGHTRSSSLDLSTKPCDKSSHLSSKLVKTYQNNGDVLGSSSLSLAGEKKGAFTVLRKHGEQDEFFGRIGDTFHNRYQNMDDGDDESCGINRDLIDQWCETLRRSYPTVNTGTICSILKSLFERNQRIESMNDEIMRRLHAAQSGELGEIIKCIDDRNQRLNLMNDEIIRQLMKVLGEMISSQFSKMRLSSVR